MIKSASFHVSSGCFRNITTGPTKFLGQLQTSLKKSNICESSKKFISAFCYKLETLDEVQVWAEYKLWIYKCYFSALLPVCPGCGSNLGDSRAIKKMQAASLRIINSWLELPRCVTTSTLHHLRTFSWP